MSEHIKQWSESKCFFSPLHLEPDSLTFIYLPSRKRMALSNFPLCEGPCIYQSSISPHTREGDRLETTASHFLGFMLASMCCPRHSNLQGQSWERQVLTGRTQRAHASGQRSIPWGPRLAIRSLLFVCVDHKMFFWRLAFICAAGLLSFCIPTHEFYWQSKKKMYESRSQKPLAIHRVLSIHFYRDVSLCQALFINWQSKHWCKTTPGSSLTPCNW